MYTFSRQQEQPPTDSCSASLHWANLQRARYAEVWIHSRCGDETHGPRVPRGEDVPTVRRDTCPGDKRSTYGIQ